MILLASITYAEQKSFLHDRIDQQTKAALFPIERALHANGVPDPGAPARAGGDGDFGERGPGGGAAPAIDLPPQTYGQRRTASGRVLGSVTLGYGQGALPPPDLPVTVTPGHLFTVDARSGGLRYRVLA